LAYLYGSINSIIIACSTLGVSCISIPRIISAGRNSIYDGYEIAKKVANFQNYFFIG
jgi:hypothetical protein